MRPARLAVAAVLLATMATAGCAVPVWLGGAAAPTERPDGIVLVPATEPTFPYTITGLGTPTDFTSAPGQFTAHYAGTNGDSAQVTAWIGPLTFNSFALTPTTIDGKNGWAWHQGRPAHRAELIWERSPDKWTQLDGTGRYGTEAALRTLAGRVTDKPQSLRFPWVIGRIPRGWTLNADVAGYATGYTYADPADPAGSSLTISGSYHIAPDLSQYVAGYIRTRTVRLNGRSMPIAQATTYWLMQGQLPNGKVFDIKAPVSFNPDTVGAIVASVTPR